MQLPVCSNVASGFQPDGLSDSSRWSQRSADHRITIENNFTPGKGVRKNGGAPSEGVTEKPGTLPRVAGERSLRSGGLRYAPATPNCYTDHLTTSL